MCSIDLVDMARAAEEAGVDFRVVALTRSVGASVVSAVRRKYGTVASQSRLLAQSEALLERSLVSVCGGSKPLGSPLCALRFKALF